MLTECEYICELVVDKVKFINFMLHKFKEIIHNSKHMRKTRKNFTFHYPLRQKVVRDLKMVTEEVGELLVEGMGYVDPVASRLDIFDRYTVDIDFVRWNGTDIRPVLEITGGMDEITEAAIRYFARLADQGMHKAA
jgi:hypothetical protein